MNVTGKKKATPNLGELEPKSKSRKLMNKEQLHEAEFKTPLRNKKGELVFKDFPTFHPNKTPKEILQAGSFGGTYFRPINSSVTNQKYTDSWKEFPTDWFEGLKISMSIANPTYDKFMNKYKVKCGASLEEWESSGWIKEQDPYGWFQWYCRFYLGRRTEDDERQIGRWNRFLARFKTNLVNKINKADTKFNNFSISPVIRQSLLHWGYEVTQDDVEKKERKVSSSRNIKNVPLLQ